MQRTSSEAKGGPLEGPSSQSLQSSARDAAPQATTSSRLFAYLFGRPKTEPCFLLERLPPEIRLRIWTLVLGGHRIHIVVHQVQGPRKKRGFFFSTRGAGHTWVYRWGNRVCERPDLNLLDHLRYSPLGFLPSYCIHGRPVDCALLHTCKAIYAEARPVLYAANAFDFQCSPTVAMSLRMFRNALGAGTGTAPGPAHTNGPAALQTRSPPSVSVPVAGLFTRFDLLVELAHVHSPFFRRRQKQHRRPEERSPSSGAVRPDDPYASLWALTLHNRDPFYDGDNGIAPSPPGTGGAGLGYPSLQHLRVTLLTIDLPRPPADLAWSEVVAFRKVFFGPILEDPAPETAETNPHTTSAFSSSLRQCDVVVPPNYAAWLGMTHGQVFAGSQGEPASAAAAGTSLEGIPASSALAKRAVFRLLVSPGSGPDYVMLNDDYVNESVGEEELRNVDRMHLLWACR